MGFPFKRIGSSPTNAGKDGGVFDKFDNYYWVPIAGNLIEGYHVSEINDIAKLSMRSSEREQELQIQQLLTFQRVILVNH